MMRSHLTLNMTHVGGRCDSGVTIEAKRNDSLAEESLHGERLRDQRTPRCSFAPRKLGAMRGSLQPDAECSGESCDLLLTDNEEPPTGAHLITPRIGYIHHGIYVGAGKVIHSGAVSRLLPRGPVEEVSLECFSRGRRVWIRSGLPARFTAQEVADRARSRVGEDHYHLLKSNCEHLCEWCLRGRERSYQVERLIRWLRFWDFHRRREGRGASLASTSLRCGAV